MPILAAPTMPDLRRITERDPDFQRIRSRTVRALGRSLDAYVDDLRAGDVDARSRFIHRHVAILYGAYLAAHKEGQRDYWQSVSRKRQPLTAPIPGKVAQRLVFFTPSVARMAAEGLSAYHAAQTRRFADGAASANADPLDEWRSDLAARIVLQADLTWSGAQDGYTDGGAGDGANPFAQVWWVLEPLARHCTDCPDLADGSPYDPPGSAGNELTQTPGDGQTACGASCKCSLEYRPGTDGANVGNILPSSMPGLTALGGDLEIPVPPGGDLTDNQKSALDAVRTAMKTWAKVRGDLPDLPSPFDAGASLDLPEWDDLTDLQQAALEAWLNGLISWSVATNLAQLDEMDAESIKLFNPNHYGPGTPQGGQFAPKGAGDGGGTSGHPIAQAKIHDPQATQAFQKALGNAAYQDINAYVPGVGDPFMRDIAHEQGFDGLPEVVSKAEMDQYVAAGETELWRGFGDDPAHAEQFMSGDYYAGRGSGGSGTYTALQRFIANYYDRGGGVYRMALKQGAHVTTPQELERLRRDYLANHPRVDLEHDMAMLQLVNNNGRFAASLGYDAIRDDAYGEMIILNRTAVRVQQEGG